jgi:hypothetical protein
MADSNNPTSVLADLLKIKSEIEENIRSIAESIYQKGSKLNPKDYEKFNKLLREQQAAYDDISKTIDVLQKQQKEQEDLIKKQNDALKQQNDTIEKQNKLLEEEKKLREDNIKSIEEEHGFLVDTEDLIASIADQLGKKSKVYKEANDYLDTQRATLKSIAALAKTSTNKELLNEAKTISDKYKEFQKSVISITEKSKLAGKTQEQIAVEVERLKKAFVASLDSLTKLGSEGENIAEEFRVLTHETETFSQTVGKVNKSFNALGAIIDQFNGIPLMREFGAVIEAAATKSGQLKAALVALSAAAGAFGGAYFGAAYIAKAKTANDIKQGELDLEMDLLKQENERGFIVQKREQAIQKQTVEHLNEINRLTIERGYAAEKAANQFAAQMQSNAASFNAAAKTAFFGGQLTGIKGNVAQLQLAGISAEKIVSQMTSAGDVMGKMPTPEVAKQMAIISTRTGASDKSVSSLVKGFMNTEKLSMESSLNMVEGMRAMAEFANIPLNSLMEEVAEASKEMVGYQIRTTSELAEQVAYTKSMGINFNDIAKAGRNMVLNYKDSIKSEMELSALLGRNVDLSEVRQYAAAGDYKSMLSALKEQGLDPTTMDIFEQDALTKTIGLDLATFKKIATGEGVDVQLGAGAAGAQNQAFLSRTQAAQAALNTQQAIISADSAIVDAKLSDNISKAYLKSDGYLKYQNSLIDLNKNAAILDEQIKVNLMSSKEYVDILAKQKQLEMKRPFTEGLFQALSGVASTIAMIGLQTLMFKKIAGIGSAVISPPKTVPPPIPKPMVSSATSTTNPWPADPRSPKPLTPTPASQSINMARAQQATAQPAAASQGGILKNLFNPKIMSKAAKVGGMGLSGLFGGYEGFSEAKEKGATTSEAAGAGFVQGALAVGGTALGAAFGGPIGAMIGGFLGNTLGGWLNENAPWFSNLFGGLFAGISDKFPMIIETVKNVFDKFIGIFTPIWEALQPPINWLAQALGGEGQGLAYIMRFVGEQVMNVVNGLIGAFGLVFDLLRAGVQLLTGNWKGAWDTFTKGFIDFYDMVLSPFKELFLYLKLSFAQFWNSIATSGLGSAIGLKSMDTKGTETQLSEINNKRLAKINEEKDVAAKEKAKKDAEKMKPQPSGVVTTANGELEQNALHVAAGYDNKTTYTDKSVKTTSNKKNLVESILGDMKTNDHSRGIITLDQMKSQVVNDNTNSGKIVTAINTQTKHFVNTGLKELFELQSLYNFKSLNIQEAMADLLGKLVEIQSAGAETSAVIQLDGEVLNKSIYSREQKMRTFGGLTNMK